MAGRRGGYTKAGQGRGRSYSGRGFVRGRGSGRGYHALESEESDINEKFCLNALKSPDLLRSSREASLFFSSLALQADVMDFLKNVASAGSKVITKAITLLDYEKSEQLESLVKFLSVIISNEVYVGLNKVFIADTCRDMLNMLGFTKAITSALSAGRFSSDSIAVLFWFLKIAISSDAQMKNKLELKPMIDEIKAFASAALQRQIHNFFALGALSEEYDGLEELRKLVPQHNNDFPEDFTRIQIVPTIEELKSSIPLEAVYRGWLGDPEALAMEMLDRQFRLLREDMIDPLREEIREIELNNNNGQQRPRLRYHRPRVTGIETIGDKASLLVQFFLPDQVQKFIKPQHINSKNVKALANFFEADGSRLLTADSILLFFDENHKLEHLGILTNRNLEFGFEDRHDKVKNKVITIPSVILRVFFEKTSLPAVLKYHRNPFAKFFVQARATIFSYYPVLKCLQEMTDIPMEEELVAEKPVLVLSDKPITLPSNVMSALTADPSQLEAAQLALSQRLTIIQGPPGTGKTYVGIQIVQALLQAMPEARILCLCYTNHALDSFLESLLDNGVSSKNVIRFGSLSRISDRIKECCYQNIKAERFARGTASLHFSLKTEISELAAEIGKKIGSFLHGDTFNINAWKIAENFLRGHSSQTISAYQQLNVSIQDNSALQFGMQLVGKKGKVVTEDYLWREWLLGKPLPAAFSSKSSGLSPGDINIWQLSKADREILVKQWYSDYTRNQLTSLDSLLSKYHSRCERHSNLREEAKLSKVQEVKILACTTTFAAKSQSLIDSFKPNILLVEEAAELHESHILINVSERIRHLIMIGDHKQLKPKLQSYALRAESGNGIGFDISLFERLIDSGYPYSTLQVQHRMRPEISSLIKCTYPDLQDHTKTLNRAHIRGLVKSVVFVDHSEPEGGRDGESPLVDKSSKFNEFEVDMVLKTARYLLQQGYEGEDLVILTPYLGQLMLFKKKMRQQPELFDVEVGERDQEQIVELEDEEKKKEEDAEEDVSNRSKSSAIRIATIDNYQGEESKIVLASLVRSNERRDIGFVSTAERVNVLLSRARDGMVLIGDAEMFRNAASRQGREVWGNVFKVLDQQGAVYQGLPTVCMRHSNKQLLKKPADFDSLAPDGGCNMPCDLPLPSCKLGHGCVLRCHPLTASEHNKFRCRMKVKCKCGRGLHSLEKVCGENCVPQCRETTDFKCQAGHLCQRPCFSELTECKQCVKIEKQRREEDSKRKKDLQAIQEELEKLEAESAIVQDEAVHAKERLELFRKQDLLKESIKTGRDMTAAHQKAIEDMKRDDSDKSRVQVQPSLSSKTVVAPIAKRNTSDKIANMDEQKTATEDLPTNATQFQQPIFSPPVPSPLPVEDSNPVPSEPTYDLRSPAYGPNGQSNLPNTSSQATHVPITTANRSQSKSLSCTKVIQSYLNGNVTETISMIAAFDDQIRVENLKQCDIIDFNARLDLSLVYLLCCFKLGQDKKGELRLCMGALEKVIKKFGLTYTSIHEGQLDNTELQLLVHFTAALIYSNDTSLKSLAIKHATDYILLASSASSSSSIMSDPWQKVWIGQMRQLIDKLSATKQTTGSQSVKNIGSTEQKNAQLTSKWKQRLEIAAQKNSKVSISSMTSLLKMVGLHSVKEQFIEIFDLVQLTKEQGGDLTNKNFNTRFDGNPGTGKTTVAKSFLKFMMEVGVLPSTCEKFLLKTGSELANNGVSQLEKDLEDLKEQGGGVVFIDEAYQLNDTQGHRILDFILGHSERMKGEFGSLIWIFAGYKNKMDDLFKHNVGLPSRFPRKFNFEDYSDEELLSILKGILERGGADVVESSPPKKPQPKPAAAKPGTLPMQGRNSNAYGSGGYYGSSGGTRSNQVDQWGNTWYWDNANYTYYDDYNNITGIGVGGLGTFNNPLVSRIDNTMWIWDSGRNLWHARDDPSRISNTYPGKPVIISVNSTAKPAKQPFVVSDEKWLRIAVRRLGQLRNVTGFGNARAVRNLFDQAHGRQVKRVMGLRAQGFDADIYTFERDDILGPKATIEKLESCDAWQELLKLEGLKTVKDSLTQLLNLVITNAEREEQEKPLLQTVLNRIFLGNPGTGKTTVAKLYGKILASLGLLSKGEVVLKNSSDFIGSALGKSEECTRGILEQSKGCVLVIDEAYGLYQNTGSGNEPYREAVINTLVEQIQGVPGEDRAVVLLGYREEMETMLSKCNPGLSRRFQLENAFIFEDYDDQALTRILIDAAKKDALDVTIEVAIFAVKMLGKARAKPHFGNAGAVNNLLSSAKLRMQGRVAAARASGTITSDDSLFKEDFTPEDYRADVVTAEELLAGLMGCDQIRDKLEEYKAVAEYNKSKGKNPAEVLSFNYVFTGKPGTGKTTIARLMGKLFCSLGLIPCEEVVEMSASDLVTGYVGQTGKKTRDIFTGARGKVLFIDEAYQLNPDNGGSFMQEAVDEIVKLLTDKEYKGKMIVILAGYEDDMDRMLNVNQGLRSRFTERIHFEDFSEGHIRDMIKKGLLLSGEAESSLLSIARQLRGLNGFANGRDVETFMNKASISKVKRLSKGMGGDIVEVIDLQQAMQELIKLKGKTQTNEQSMPQLPKQQFAHQNSLPPPPPSFAFEKATIEELDEIEPKKVRKEEVAEDPTEKRFLSAMQEVLDRKGLNSLEGVRRLSSISPDSRDFFLLAAELSRQLDLAEGTVRDLLVKWQGDQAKVQEEVRKQKEEEEKAKQQGRRALVPIWRCAVCGRADQPVIICYVSPFVVRYEERELK